MRYQTVHLRRTASLLAVLTLLAGCTSTTEPTAFAWTGTYTTATKFGGATGTWQPDASIEITADGRVIRGGTVIQNPTITADQIVWSLSDGNSTSAELDFTAQSSSTYFWSAPVSGRLFQGWIQSSGNGKLDFRGLVQ
ncbi:MAG: hypothetical protein ACREPM_22570 [Gemmatimonadaceae bacterium]